MKIYKFGKIPTGSVQEMKGMLRLIDNSIPQIIVLSATTETTERLAGIAAIFSTEIQNRRMTR